MPLGLKAICINKDSNADNNLYSDILNISKIWQIYFGKNNKMARKLTKMMSIVPVLLKLDLLLTILTHLKKTLPCVWCHQILHLMI